MIRMWLLVISVTLLGAIGSGHAEDIGVFKDTGGCFCLLYDTSPGLMTVTVLHVNSQGATGSRFAAPMSSCMHLVTWLSDTAVFSGTVGNSQDGVSIDYDQCITGNFQILTINYFVQGYTEECCWYGIEPDPGASSGQVEVVDCEDQVVFVLGMDDLINSSANCACLMPPFCYPVAIESSTWGKIKALFQR
ncbi:MAG: hypothetical protein JSW58_07285 [Candidatus Latescibacterota bacterium]|nr:MAG: hypothetical protein JSW58_07285 [Candidatus Latescibacterota bacterium]